jgi:hypothetical protein
MFSATEALSNAKNSVSRQLNNLTSSLQLNDAYEALDAQFDQIRGYNGIRYGNRLM